MTDEAELEQERLADLDEAEIENPENFLPGSFGCHEALHTASMLMEMVHSHLLEHPAILLDSEFYRRARNVHSELFDLYQALGTKHLGADEEAAEMQGNPA